MKGYFGIRKVEKRLIKIMDNSFKKLTTLIASKTQLPLYPHEVRKVAFDIIELYVLQNPGVIEFINETITDDRFPEVKIRLLRKQIKESRKNSPVKVTKIS